MSAEMLSTRRQASSDVTHLSYEDVSESRGSVCFLYCRRDDANGPGGERRICAHLRSKKASNNPLIQATTLLSPAGERQSTAASEKVKSRWLPAVLRAGAWRAPQTPSSRWGRKTRSAAAPEAAEVWSEPTEGNLGCSSGIARQPVGNDRHTGGVSALFNSAVRRVRGHEEETEAISSHHFVSSPPPHPQPCRAETLCASVGGRNISESRQKVHQSASSVATVKYPAFLLVGRQRPRPRESCIFAPGATRIQGEKQGG